jgi:hypothetical protein
MSKARRAIRGLGENNIQNTIVLGKRSFLTKWRKAWKNLGLPDTI